MTLSFDYSLRPEALTWPKRKGRKALDEIVHGSVWQVAAAVLTFSARCARGSAPQISTAVSRRAATR